MNHIKISAQLPDHELGEIKKCLEGVRMLMPFLVALTIKERQKLFKMGDKGVAFVEDSLMAAKNHPELLPSSFDLDAYEQEAHLAATLHDLRMELNKLSLELHDTERIIRSQAIDHSREVYVLVKCAAQREPALNPLAAQLGARFLKAPREKDPGAPDEKAA